MIEESIRILDTKKEALTWMRDTVIDYTRKGWTVLYNGVEPLGPNSFRAIVKYEELSKAKGK